MRKITPQEIKSRLIINGTSQASIARKLGVSKALVSMTVNGKEKNKRVRRAIAKAIKIPVREIWPKINGEE